MSDGAAPAPQRRPERLAFLLPNLRGGGAERVALTLIRDFLARGYEVDLVLAKAEGELLHQVPEGVTIVDLGAARFTRALVPLIRYLKTRRPHALQVRMWPLTVIALIARTLARSSTRVVVSDHAQLSSQYGESWRSRLLLGITVALFYPGADARILVSAGAADDLANLCGIDRDSISVIYNPIPAADPAPLPADLAGLWRDGEARLVTAGSLIAVKNHALLIAAFARLRRTRPARLAILGDGDMRAALADQAQREGVADAVSFLGFRDDPAACIASADLFVLSSDHEGFGNVLVEAMAVGVNVVSTDCPSGPREILENGRYGRLVPTGNAEALAAAMSDALEAPLDPYTLKARAEAISGRATIDRYLDLLIGPPPEPDA